MSEEGKRETEQKKREGSRQGNSTWTTPKRHERLAMKPRKTSPLDGYEDLNVDEVKTKAQGLSSEEVGEILAYEKQHENRKTLVEHLAGRADDGS